MNDPEYIRFNNEVVRPMAERMRSLVADLKAIGPDVDRLLPGLTGHEAEAIEDGRQGEGVSLMTVADVLGLAAIREAMLGLVTPEAEALVSKACVRPAIRSE